MSVEAILKYPIVFLAALLTALLVTPVWQRLAPRWGFVDSPGVRKIHRTPMPRGGGIAVFLGFHAACAAVFLPAWQPFEGQMSIGWWYRFLPLSAGVVLLGLLDDRFNLGPRLKLFGQIALAIAAYAVGIRVQNILGLTLPGWLDLVATVFWLVALTNAFNLIDGVDGLATGIAAIAAVGIGVLLVFRKEPGDVLMMLGFAGACLGFLRYNAHPASVFLGDAGSMFIGFTLAALSMSTNSKSSFMAGIGAPLLAAGVPLFDALLAVWRRSMRRILWRDSEGKAAVALDQADADHLHHRLLREGRGQAQVAWLLYGATTLLALVGLLASLFRDRALGILVLAFLLAVCTVVRHLVGIELLESGRVVLRGLSRPVRRNRTLLFYLVGDLLILNLVLLVARAILSRQAGIPEVELKPFWLRNAPIDVVAPFMALLFFRSYSRVWYLARISEYAATGMAVILGYLGACGLRWLGVAGSNIAGGWTLHYVLLAGMACPAIVFSRAGLRVVQDLMQRRARGDGAGVRALMVGAGYRTTLFLRQIAFDTHDHAAVEVVGIVSDDLAVKGHDVHGIRVIGAIRELPTLVARHNIQAIYLVEPISDAQLAEMRQSLRGLDVRLLRWDIVETEIPLPTA